MTEHPADKMQPWTIKSVATRTREAVVTAAQRDGVTVGQWLERRVDEWLDAGSPVRQSYPVSDLVNLCQAAAALAGASGRIPVVRAARLSLESALLATSARAAAPPKQLSSSE